MTEIEYKIPKDASNYIGEFIVFFSDEENPQVLFHSLIPDEAYAKAKEIEKENGKIVGSLRRIYPRSEHGQTRRSTGQRSFNCCD